MYKYCIVNDTITLQNDRIVPPENAPVFYEVVRVINGIPLFFQEHTNRLLHSCSIENKKININHEHLFKCIVQLSQKNQCLNGNVLINVFFDDDRQNLIAYFIPHVYPEQNLYTNGVCVDFLHAERNNPEAKIVQQNIREKANRIISEKNVYEVLLVNENNEITEGSRSNFFCIKNNTLYTPPLHKVLRGITLEKVLYVAEKQNINIRYEAIMKNELDFYDSAFITGTSPKILPLASAVNYEFDVNNKILRLLMQLYNDLINNYLRHYKT